MKQLHLRVTQEVNMGSYYTPPKIVDLFAQQAKEYIMSSDIIMDNAAGYGSFIRTDLFNNNFIAADIDAKAIDFIRSNNECNRITLLERNALSKNTRKKYGIQDTSSLVILSNIPFSDSTSFTKRDKKAKRIVIENDYPSRDLGISILKSFIDLKPRIIAIIHPTSFLTKVSNIKQLKSFYQRYKVEKTTIFNANNFDSLKNKNFPLSFTIFKSYDGKEMSPDIYEDITYLDSSLEPKRKKFLKVNDFSAFACKYKSCSKKDVPYKYFYTLRDFGFLKRNRDFIESGESSQAIIVSEEKYKYFCLLKSMKRRLTDNHYYIFNYNPFFMTKTNEKIFSSAIKETENEESGKDIRILDNYFKSLIE